MPAQGGDRYITVGPSSFIGEVGQVTQSRIVRTVSYFANRAPRSLLCHIQKENSPRDKCQENFPNRIQPDRQYCNNHTIH